MARCQEFYKTVFGWEFSNAVSDKIPTGSYATFSKPGTKLAGGMPLVKEENLLQPAITSDGRAQATNRITMKVEEVSAALKNIEAAGGKTVFEKMEIGGGMGYSGQFRDTEGNVNGVWSTI